MRIKLPGSIKFKLTILIILILVALGIFIYEGTNNRKQLELKEKQQQALLEEKQEEAKKEKQIEEELKKKKEELEKIYNNAYEAFFNKERTKAIELTTEIINKDPNYYMAYNLRGISKAYNKNLDEGLKDIDKALELAPDYGYARFNKALAYELFGRYEEALIWYNKALEVEDYQWSYYGIASIYGRRGEVENTVKYLKKAVDKDPAIKEIAKEESDFNPVKNSPQFKELVK